MKNIDTAFRYVRLFSLLFLVGCGAICCYTIYSTQQQLTENRGKVFVLVNGKLVEAIAMNRDIPVEIRDHVKDFHGLFFTFSPDEKLIQQQITKALYLADGSARRQYQNLKESSYYSNIVSGNISQRVEVDSIQLDMDANPCYFKCIARQIITRPTAIIERKLITEGRVRTGLLQSDNNNHGFLIEKWQILDNSDIKIINR